MLKRILAAFVVMLAAGIVAHAGMSDQDKAIIAAAKATTAQSTCSSKVTNTTNESNADWYEYNTSYYGNGYIHSYLVTGNGHLDNATGSQSTGNSKYSLGVSAFNAKLYIAAKDYFDQATSAFGTGSSEADKAVTYYKAAEDLME